MNVFGVLLGFACPMIFIDNYTAGSPLTEAQKSDYES